MDMDRLALARGTHLLRSPSKGGKTMEIRLGRVWLVNGSVAFGYVGAVAFQFASNTLLVRPQLLFVSRQ